MLIGGVSLAGVPPLGGFFSKESVFGVSWELGAEGNPFGWIMFVAAALAAIMTFYYTLRMLGLTFLGKKTEYVEKYEKEHGGHLHKPSPILWIPLVILSVGTIVLGFLSPIVQNFITKNTWFAAMSTWNVEESVHSYGSFLGHTFGFAPPTFWITLGILGLGGLFGVLFYWTRTWDAVKVKEKSKFVNALNTFFYKRWYMNSAIYWGVRKFKLFAELAYEYFDLKVIDGANYAIASGTTKSGEVFRKTHTGILSVNFIYILLGLVVLIAVFLLIFMGGA
jgi:NADH-quinone oxidoreductase subunit L